jgi:hypothetical protein
MLCHARHRLGCLVLLLLLMQGLVVSGIGETLSHGPATSNEVSHQHGAISDHVASHERVTEHSPLHYEGGSHFHETADRIVISTLHEPILAASLRIGYRYGIPLRRPSRLERPPRLLIAV